MTIVQLVLIIKWSACSSVYGLSLTRGVRVRTVARPIRYVTAMVKGDTGPTPGHWAIKGGNSQAGLLKTYWNGPRPPRCELSSHSLSIAAQACSLTRT